VKPKPKAVAPQKAKVEEGEKGESDEEVKKELEQPVGYNQAREEEKKRNKERLEEIRRKRELAAKEKEEQNQKVEEAKKQQEELLKQM